jgi:hypothetical protein
MRTKVQLTTLLFLAACAAPAQAATLYAFTAQEVYVRNDRGAFVLGTAKGPAFRPIPGLADTVLVQRYEHGRDWGYGLVSGHFPAWQGERCGWVHLQRSRGHHHVKYVRRISTGHARACHSTGKQLKEAQLFRKGSYIHAAGAGSVYGAMIRPCADSRAFGNYNPASGQFTDPYPVALPFGHGFSVPGFGQRYVTADGRAAMLKDSSHVSGGPIWYFVHAECVDRLASEVGSVRHLGRCCVGLGIPHRGRPYTLGLKRYYVLTMLRFRAWGGDMVRSKSLLIHNTCRPTCQTGATQYRNATVKLSRRRGGVCDGRTVMFYTRLSAQWRVPHTRHTKKVTRKLVTTCAPY